MYDKAIDLAEQRSSEIVKEAARLIHREKIAIYVNVPADMLAERLLPALRLHLKYLRLGNIEEWRTVISKFIEEKTKQGIEYTDMIKTGQLISQAMAAFFQQELGTLTTFGGESAPKMLAGLQRRLQGMDMLGVSTATSAGLKHNSVKPPAKNKQP